MKNNKETKAAQTKVAAVEENVPEQVNGAVEEPAVAAPKADKPVPPFVKNILQGYPNEEYLYVDAKGGAYSSETPEAYRKGAVLYKNPYFENL